MPSKIDQPIDRRRGISWRYYSGMMVSKESCLAGQENPATDRYDSGLIRHLMTSQDQSEEI
jgi:hypothetical protein